MNSTTIIISRSPSSDERHAFEDQLVVALRETPSTHIIVVPSVYALPDDSPALAAIADVADDDILLASWLHPRAALWALKARGIDGDADDGESAVKPSPSERTLRALNMACFDSAAECAAKISDMLSSDEQGEASVIEIGERPPER